jgi:hypothetical protein
MDWADIVRVMDNREFQSKINQAEKPASTTN